MILLLIFIKYEYAEALRNLVNLDQVSIMARYGLTTKLGHVSQKNNKALWSGECRDCMTRIFEKTDTELQAFADRKIERAVHNGWKRVEWRFDEIKLK